MIQPEKSGCLQFTSNSQPQSHPVSYTQYNFTSPTTFTIRDNAFTWDSNRLATRGEGDTTWNYTYDAKGQVEKAHRTFGAGEVLAGCQNIYVYDDIGNRKELQECGGSASNQDKNQPNSQTSSGIGHPNP